MNNFNCVWSKHRCETLTTSKRYSNVSFFYLLKLIRGKLASVVLEIIYLWVLNSPKHFLDLNRPQISFCPSGKLPYMSCNIGEQRDDGLSVLFILICVLSSLSSPKGYLLSCLMLFFWTRSAMVAPLLLNANIHKTKSNPIHNSLWYVVSLDRKEHYQILRW